jgi:hypothetical protein
MGDGPTQSRTTGFTGVRYIHGLATKEGHRTDLPPIYMVWVRRLLGGTKSKEALRASTNAAGFSSMHTDNSSPDKTIMMYFVSPTDQLNVG